MPSQETVVITDVACAEKTFTYDRAYWSTDPQDMHYADQNILMMELGLELQENALQGFNSCLFAYGQTGSGKTYSVLGQPSAKEHKGILPRIIEEVFATMGKKPIDSEDAPEYHCSVTYVEIYNEVIRDLLSPSSAKLEVKSNPKVGVYIQGLNDVPVFDTNGVLELLDFGAKARTVGATCMNDQSSRSHCIFTLEIVSKRQNSFGGQTQLQAKLNLVDLAGSERQAKAQSSGARLQEGSMINKSLSSLALVIAKLAETSEKKRARSKDFVPFRNSKLTLCLKESLSGNSRTVMIAALSPALSNYEETLSTLRFAASVKQIKTKATRNEACQEGYINELKAEVERLRAQLAAGKGDHQDLADMQEMVDKYGEISTGTKEMRQHRSSIFFSKRQDFLKSAGLSTQGMTQNLGLDDSIPHLVNVCTDSSLSGCLVYFLMKTEEITCGSAKDSKIVLSGLGMAPLMAILENTDDINITIRPVGDGRVLVNGMKISETTQLRNGSRLILGYSFCFRVVIPLAAADDNDQQEHGTMEHALSEVVPEQSEAYEQCRVYVEELNSRLGAYKAQKFLIQFQKANVLAEEANLISKSVRPLDRYFFNVEVIVDTFQYQQDEPECVVRLKKFLTGVRRLKDLIQRHIIEKTRKASLYDTVMKMKSRKMSEALSLRKERGRPEPFDTVAVWDIDAFKLRLVYLREAYEVFEMSGGEPLNFDSPENDPWQVPEPWHLSGLFQLREQLVRDQLAFASPMNSYRSRSGDTTPTRGIRDGVVLHMSSTKSEDRTPPLTRAASRDRMLQILGEDSEETPPSRSSAKKPGCASGADRRS
jgi:hypothetical protein